MTVLRTLQNYSDNNGNRIEYDGPAISGVEVHFIGKNNSLIVDSTFRSNGNSIIRFDCSDAKMQIGRGLHGFSCFARLGEESTIIIGDKVTSSGRVLLCALEGTTLAIGTDVMFSADVQVRCDDEHPIFDVHTERRINNSSSVSIGDHVWLGWGSRILAGTKIGDGTVIGTGTIAKGLFPNNCILAGIPARITRRDIAWERDHLSLKKPYYKPTSESVEKSSYWNKTVEAE